MNHLLLLLLLRYLFLSYLFSLLSSFSSSQTPTTPLSLKHAYQCLHHEKSALLQLQLESMSTNSTRSGIWQPETDCCSWEGVMCNTTSGHVIGLDLSSRLTTPINSSSSLFRLRNLQRLNLAYNDFELTPIPSGFDRLANLTHLNLSDSCFSGQIPPEISHLTRLVSLVLSAPSLCIPPTLKIDEQDHLKLDYQESEAWYQNVVSYYKLKHPKLERPDLRTLVQNLTSLRELYLDGIQISAQSSDWGQALAYALPNLRVLSLSYCGISGPIHSSLSRLRFLSELHLDGNNLSIEVPSFLENLTHLKTISLRSCGLHGKFPENVFRLPNLQKLDVSENFALIGQLPDFPPNNVFRVLSLSGTNFSRGIPVTIGNLKFLIELNLFGCNFSGRIPETIGNLKFLTKLDISDCNFLGLIPPSLTNLTRLVELDLSSNSFSGTIHSSLFTLPSLQYLSLFNNQLNGQLDEFPNASISLLETVDLGWNQLKGQIPKSIAKLSRLQTLSLGHNSFNGTLMLDTFQNLKHLSDLSLSNNNLSIKFGKNSFRFPQFEWLSLASCHLYEFPDFLRNQEKLVYLDLSNNQLHGPVPHWIWKRTLRWLYLSGNTISFLEPSFQYHSNSSKSINNGDFVPELFELDLRSCNLSEFPDFLKDQNKLGELDLSNNNIRGQLPNWLWKQNLRYLNLSYNSLNVLEQPLPNLTLASLYTLDLHSNMLNGSIPIISPSIRLFSISNNTFSGEIPDSICKLSGLDIFDASHNNLSGRIPECLVNIGTLWVLNVQGNRFQSMPQLFTNSSSLSILNINRNKIEGKLPRSLVNCTMLEVLDLGRNMIYDTFPYWLETLPLLRVLALRSNKFYGPIERPRINHGFPLLHIMDLSSNGFTGNLPTEYFRSWKAMMSVPDDKSELKYIGSDYYSVTIMNKGLEMVLVRIVTSFTSIDLSNNKFQGEIPEVIGDLKSLLVLNLSHNDLMGRIPSSIGNLAQLESLDLSQNKLVGEIPWQLTSLTFLEVLDLSQNQLDGRIPQGRQFDTFSNTSYEKNEGLCGLPLSKSCKDANDDIPPQSKVSHSTSEFDWEFMLIGYGCGMVIGIVTGYTIFWTKDECFMRTSRRRT